MPWPLLCPRQGRVSGDHPWKGPLSQVCESNVFPSTCVAVCTHLSVSARISLPSLMRNLPTFVLTYASKISPLLYAEHGEACWYKSPIYFKTNEIFSTRCKQCKMGSVPFPSLLNRAQGTEVVFHDIVLL